MLVIFKFEFNHRPVDAAGRINLFNCQLRTLLDRLAISGRTAGGRPYTADLKDAALCRSGRLS